MATEAPTDIIERLIAEPWRIEPHTFAAHVSEGKWKPWPYLAYIGERITEAIAKGNGRLIVNMPPGHGKSELGRRSTARRTASALLSGSTAPCVTGPNPTRHSWC
jgi:hypothetical protein